MIALRVFGCREGSDPEQMQCPFADGEWMVCCFPTMTSDRGIGEYMFGFDQDGSSMPPAPDWCPIAVEPAVVSRIGGAT